MKIVANKADWNRLIGILNETFNKEKYPNEKRTYADDLIWKPNFGTYPLVRISGVPSNYNTTFYNTEIQGIGNIAIRRQEDIEKIPGECI